MSTEELFAAIYASHFDFVWRSARRLGVADHAVDDVVQDVFVVVHRRLADFEGRSAVKTWLFGIILRVVRGQRRSRLRKRRVGSGGDVEPLEGVVDERSPTPAEQAERSEARDVLYGILDRMGEQKRAVFVMAELEQLTAPEIGEVLGINVNTVYSRLRAARQLFNDEVARHQSAEVDTP